ncbi:hypothetical protein ABPG75_009174 [Micractinium tetrahymenae]
MGRAKGGGRAAQTVGQLAELAAGAEGTAAAQDGPGASATCCICRHPVLVHSEDHIAGQCSSCGAVRLHRECVSEALSKKIKAEWISSKGTLAATMIQVQQFPWKVLAKLASSGIGVPCFGCQEGRLQSADLQRPVRKLVPLPAQAVLPGPRRGKAAGVTIAAAKKAACKPATAKQPRQQRQQQLEQHKAAGAGVAAALDASASKPKKELTFAQLQEQEAKRVLQEERKRRQQLKAVKEEERRKVAEAAAVTAARLRQQPAGWQAGLQHKTEGEQEQQGQVQGWTSKDWEGEGAGGADGAVTGSADSSAGWQLYTPEAWTAAGEAAVGWAAEQQAAQRARQRVEQWEALPWLHGDSAPSPQPSAPAAIDYDAGYAAGLAAAAAQLQGMGSNHSTAPSMPSTPSIMHSGLPDWLHEPSSAAGSAAGTAGPCLTASADGGAAGTAGHSFTPRQPEEEVEDLLALLGLG